MIIYLSGSTGFIGSNLVKKLKKFKLKFKKIKRNSVLKKNNKKNICLVHLAGIAHKKTSYKEMFEANVEYPIKLSKQLLSINLKKIIFISSIAVYGKTYSYKKISENTKKAPYDNYGKSKLEAERKIISFCKKNKISLIILRPTLVYGKNAPGNIRMLTKIANFFPILPFGAATHKRNLLNIEDLLTAIISSIKYKNKIIQIFNICEKNGVSLVSLLKNLTLNKNFFLNISIPKPVMKIFFILIKKKKIYNQLFKPLNINSNKIRNVLGWKEKYNAKKNFNNY